MNEKRDPPARYFSEAAWDRYRAAYEECGRDSDDFFPEVGMAPVENGALLAAALYVSKGSIYPRMAHRGAFWKRWRSRIGASLPSDPPRTGTTFRT